MRRFLVSLPAALLLASSATAVVVAAPTVADQHDVPTTRTHVNTTRSSSLSLDSPSVVRTRDRYAELHRFEVRQWDCAEFLMRSGEVNSVLRLETDDGMLLAEDDNSGGGRDALLSHTFEDTRTIWVIATTAEPNETGSYTLTVRLCGGAPLPAPGVPAPPVRPVTPPLPPRCGGPPTRPLTLSPSVHCVPVRPPATPTPRPHPTPTQMI